MKKQVRFLIGSSVVALVLFVVLLGCFAFFGKAYVVDTSNGSSEVQTGIFSKTSSTSSSTQSDEPVAAESFTKLADLRAYEGEVYTTTTSPDGEEIRYAVEKPNANNTYVLDVEEAYERSYQRHAAEQMASLPNLLTAYAGTSYGISGYSYNASNSYYYSGWYGSCQAYGTNSSSNNWWRSCSCATYPSDTLYVYIQGDLNTARSYGRITGYVWWNWWYHAWGNDVDSSYGGCNLWGCVSWNSLVVNSGGVGSEGRLDYYTSANYYQLSSGFGTDYIAAQAYGGGSSSDGSGFSTDCSIGIDMRITDFWMDFYFSEASITVNTANAGGCIENVSDWSLRFYEQSVIQARAYAGWYFTNWSGWVTHGNRVFQTDCGFQYSSNPWYTANFAQISVAGDGTHYTYNGSAQGPVASCGRSMNNYYYNSGWEGISKPTNVGTYYHYSEVAGDKGYGYTDYRTFYIDAKQLNSSTVTISGYGAVTYNGAKQTPSVNVYDNARGVYLSKDSDYTVSYGENINAGTGSITVMGINNYTDSYTVDFTINKCTPSLSGISAGTLTYGQTLSALDISGTAKMGSTKVVGRWGWANGSTLPAVANSWNTDYGVYFYPDDTENFNTASSSVTVGVNCATPTLKVTGTGAITYGQSLENSWVSGVAKNPYNGSLTASGSWYFTSGGTKPSCANSNSTSYGVTFASSDNNYNSNTITATLPVYKAVPKINSVSNVTINFEQSLTDSMLSGSVTNAYDGSTVGGNFYWYTKNKTAVGAYSDSNGKAANTGSYINFDANTFYSMPVVALTGNQCVVFVPSDTANYVSTCSTSALKINKINQIIYTEDPTKTKDNPIGYESMATYDNRAQYGYAYAEYEVAQGKTFTLTAYTTAYYPKFTDNNIIVTTSDGGSLVSVDKVEYEQVTRNSRNCSLVKVTLTAKDNCGIVKVNLDQYNNANYNNAEQKSILVFVKNVQNITNAKGNDGFYDRTGDKSKTYGNSAFDVAPKLSSGFGDYELTSSNSEVVSVGRSDSNKLNRKLTIKNAGTVTLTLTHPGYVEKTAGGWLAFMACTETMDVTVNPATLQISIKAVNVEYGTAPTFVYLFTGFKNNDKMTVPVRVTGNSYNFAAMRDVGSYEVKPTGAENTGKYANYVFEYVSSPLTIAKSTLTVTIDDMTKSYGDVTPDFALNIVGFKYDDTRADITVPTVNYGETKSNQFQNIGTYPISINNDGVSDNYKFNIKDTATLTIIPAPINIEYTPWDVDFDGLAHSKLATFSGVTGGSEPINLNNDSVKKYSYSTDMVEWSDAEPILASSYFVKISFTCAPGDNYKTTEVIIPAGLVINTVDPTLFINSSTATYTASIITLVCAVSGVDDVYLPEGTIQYLYSSSANPSNFLPTEPLNVDTYNIKVIYTHGANDNYHDFEKTFENVLVIEKAFVKLSLASKGTTYTTNGLEPTKVSPETASVKGLGTDALSDVMYVDQLKESRLSYEFSRYVSGWTKDNAVWTEDLPYNAGNYYVKVSYNAADLQNYKDTEVIFENAIVIDKASLWDTIELDHTVATYTGDIIKSKDPDYSGLQGGSEPTGIISFSFRRSGSSTYTPASGREDSGTYDVLIEYISGNDDNYAACTKEFIGVFQILKAEPTITFKIISAYNFNGSSFPAEATATGTGLGNDVGPLGEITYEYFINNEWISGYAPSNAGSYDVRATYTTKVNSYVIDNYATTTFVKENYIVINKVAPSLSINFVEAEYTGQPLEFETPLANTRGGTYDQTGPQGFLTYKFCRAGADEWTEDAPCASGSYDILVTYTALSDENYTDTSKKFLNGILINNIPPTISLRSKTVTYDGTQVSANKPSINEDQSEALGTITVEYRINNQWSPVMPSNAGVYNVRVVYKAAPVDNYKSYSQVFNSALTIKPLAITVTPVAGQVKVYDGECVDPESILFEASAPLLKGNVWTGSLEASENANVGQYEITEGTLSAGGNYVITFESGVLYRINRRPVSLIFPEINPIYDGSYKNTAIMVDPESLIGDDAVTVTTGYDGDNRNVGTFKAVAYMSDLNYTLPEEYTKEYTILPARMAGNTYNSYEVAYDGKAHPLTITTMMKGATVTYDSPTSYFARGSYTVIATVSRPNYYDETLTATLTIVKGKYDVNVYELNETYYYGNELPSLKSDCDNYGTVTLDEGQTLLPEISEYTWTFVPNDPENYETTTGTTKITVAKAKAEFVISGPLTQSTDAPETIEIVAVNGNEKYSANITYTSTDGTVFYSRPTVAGRYTMTATFSGNDLYEASEYSTIITITEKADLWWIWLIVGIVALLGAASIVFFVFKKKKTNKYTD